MAILPDTGDISFGTMAIQLQKQSNITETWYHQNIMLEYVQLKLSAKSFPENRLFMSNIFSAYCSERQYYGSVLIYYETEIRVLMFNHFKKFDSNWKIEIDYSGKNCVDLRLKLKLQNKIRQHTMQKKKRNCRNSHCTSIDFQKNDTSICFQKSTIKVRWPQMY